MSAVLGEVASVRFLRGRLMDEGMRLFGSLIILMPGRSILRRTVLGKDSLVVASEVDISFDSKGESKEVHIPIRVYAVPIAVGIKKHTKDTASLSQASTPAQILLLQAHEGATSAPAHCEGKEEDPTVWPLPQ